MWRHLCVTSFMCDVIYMWRLMCDVIYVSHHLCVTWCDVIYMYVIYMLYVTLFMCDAIYMWHYLCVTSFMCDIIYLWHHLCVTSFICDVIYVWLFTSKCETDSRQRSQDGGIQYPMSVIQTTVMSTKITAWNTTKTITWWKSNLMMKFI